MAGMQPATGTTSAGIPGGCLGPGFIIICMISGVIPGGSCCLSGILSCASAGPARATAATRNATARAVRKRLVTGRDSFGARLHTDDTRLGTRLLEGLACVPAEVD